MDESQAVVSGEPAVLEESLVEVPAEKVALSLRGVLLLVLLAVVVGLMGLAVGRNLLASTVPQGPLAPEISLPSVGGGQVSLSDFRGRRNVVLVFFRGAF